jgi:hypothetical protein
VVSPASSFECTNDLLPENVVLTTKKGRISFCAGSPVFFSNEILTCPAVVPGSPSLLRNNGVSERVILTDAGGKDLDSG